VIIAITDKLKNYLNVLIYLLKINVLLNFILFFILFLISNFQFLVYNLNYFDTCYYYFYMKLLNKSLLINYY